MLLIQKKSTANFSIAMGGELNVLLEEFFALLIALREQFANCSDANIEMFQQILWDMTAPDSELWQIESEKGEK